MKSKYASTRLNTITVTTPMKTINRLMANICSTQLSKSKDFYTKLFDFNVDYDSDWFVHLISNNKQLELGIIDRNNDLVPAAYQNVPNGFYLTFVVDNVDDVYETAQTEQYEVIGAPTDTFYGQRRLLLKDPDGTLVDVSAPIPNFEF